MGILFASSLAMAQVVVPDAQNGAASAGRAEKQQIQIPDNSITVSPRVEVKQAQSQNAPPGAEKISFQLKHLEIAGVTVYEPEELSPIYQDKIGKTIKLTELYAIAAELTRKYRNDGYVLTQVVIPPQTIDGGTVKLQVIEGYISQVKFQGDDKGMGLIRKYASQIKSENGPTNIRDLERWMLLINDLPGVSARGVLSPSSDQTGSADLTVVVERDSLNGLVGLDNYGSRYLGPTQLTGALSENSLLGLNEKLTGQLVTTPTSGANPELAYIGLDYLQPVSDQGSTIDIFSNKSLTNPGFDLKRFDVSGRSDFAGATIRTPIIRSRDINLTSRATFDYRNVYSYNNLEPTRVDNIRALRFGSKLEMVDQSIGIAFDTIDLEIAHGVKVLNSSEKNDPNLSRASADPDFFKISGEIQRLQKITDSVNVLTGVTGQFASTPLYSSEEFGVGGSDYGRGYDPSEIIGEDGVGGKFEVQWTRPSTTPFLNSYQLFGFYDIGKIWNKRATTSAQKIDSLASTGFGVRLDLPKNINATFLLAFPLTRAPQTEDPDQARMLFSLTKRF